MTVRIAALSALIALAGCGPDASAGNRSASEGAAPQADLSETASLIPVPPRRELEAAQASIPDPQLAEQVAADGHYDAADCVVHIGQLDPVPDAAGAALDRASDAWRRSLARELGGDTGASQMIGSSVNMLQPTPAPLRQAAVAWCLDNAPAA